MVIDKNTIVPQKGLTQDEFELIQQLVQKGLERDAPILYEHIDGYDVPPRTQFSMLNKPALSIKFGQMTFNMACIRLFEGVQYILPLINAEKKKFAIALCKEEESAAIIWAKKKGDAVAELMNELDRKAAPLIEAHEWDGAANVYRTDIERLKAESEAQRNRKIQEIEHMKQDDVSGGDPATESPAIEPEGSDAP